MRELKPTTEESIRHFETQQKRYVREHNGKLCPHYANAIIALRRAQPENSRQHALQTGVCPMCEDCPDGCPILAPNDSRNAQEKEPCEFCKSGYTSTGKSLAEYVSDDEYNFCPMCGRPLKGEGNDDA